MNENIEKLLQLIKENPDLPIMPMVDGDVVCSSDYGHWIGKFGSCKLDEYLIDDWNGNGCVRFKSNEYDYEIIESIAEFKYSGTVDGYEKAKKEIESMWKKVIVVYINVPD